jgi:4a-hydroxytetrahydrobiopterin dehydratase
MPDLEYIKLSDDEIANHLRVLDGWTVENGLLTKIYAFKTYKDGVVFGSAIGFVADHINHHPDVTVSYGKVTVAVNTHDVGGISPYDFELARRIDALQGQ